LLAEIGADAEGVVYIAVLAPSDKTDRPSQSEMATFTEEQARLFLEAVAESPYHELLTVALYTGMRRSELLGLP
jgi:integrase